MHIEEIENMIDTKIKENNKEFYRAIGVMTEQIRSDFKIGFELLAGRMIRFEKKMDSLEEMVAQNTVDIKQNTEGITSLNTMVKKNTKDIAKNTKDIRENKKDISSIKRILQKKVK